MENNFVKQLATLIVYIEESEEDGYFVEDSFQITNNIEKVKLQLGLIEHEIHKFSKYLSSLQRIHDAGHK